MTEEALGEILKFNLEKDGYQVDTALSAEEALEMDLTRYDLFIVDIMMERLSGFDFAKRVKDLPRLRIRRLFSVRRLSARMTRLWVLTWAAMIISPSLS